MRVIDAIGADGLRHLDTVFLAEEEIVLAMAGRYVHQACAGIHGYKIGSEYG